MYPGEHPAIVDEALWVEVQGILTGNRVGQDTGAGYEEPSLLAGLVYDAQGERLTPSHAVKRGTRYRYYVSQPLLTGAARDGEGGTGKPTGQRLPAAALEGLVKTRLRELLACPAELVGALQDLVGDATEQKQVLEAAAYQAETWSEFPAETVRRLLLAAVPRIQVHLDRVEIALDPVRLVGWLKADGEPDACVRGMWSGAQSSGERGCLTLVVLAQLKRVGIEVRLVVAGAEEGRAPDASITRILVRAHAIRDRLMQDASLTVEEVARQEELVPSYVTRLLRLTYLAPDIIAGLLTGKHPLELTARKLMSDTRLPLDWSEQRLQLGFAAG
jgi:hypothetical protein